MVKINYDGRVFASAANAPNGEVSTQTTFHYHQREDIVWAEYSGGEVIKGFLPGTASDSGVLNFTYQHVNSQKQMRAGICESMSEQLPDGRLLMLEKWQWLNGDGY